ncbi:hypothetical protein I4U23_002600 [Adineta vaga]|nr:hypothetical protein I4U23_002600 [Adineta vaga]
MIDQDVPKRSRSKNRRRRVIRYLSLVILGALSSSITFLITFYATSEFIFDGLSSIFVSQSTYEWFHTTERQRIIGAAIDLGFTCLVFQATDKLTNCWSNEADIYQNKDVHMFTKGLEGFFKDHPELILLPRFTFGSSSGGIFSSILAINQQYPIQGQIIFTSIILPEILYTYVQNRSYPATAWIHMLRDIEFASEQRINVSKQIFIEQKIPCITLPIEPVQLTSTTFHDRIPEINRDTSHFLYHQLQRYRWLNQHAYLMYNPRRKFDWQGFLFPSVYNRTLDQQLVKNIHQHKTHITEFLNTIYGEHEISYERSFEAFKWLLDIYKTAKTSNQI